MAALSAVDPTGELAQQEPGFDAAPVIAATEHGLLDFLNTPAQQMLGQLPLQRFPQDAPGDQAPADPAGPSSVDPMQVLSPILGGLGALASGLPGLPGLDPAGLIAPVVNALGTLGTGQFSGIDPTQILSGVSGAFDRTAAPLQQARGAVAEDWQGASGVAVDTKTWQIIKKFENVGPDLQTMAVTYDGKYVLQIFSGFQRLESGVFVFTQDTLEPVGYLPNFGGHHDCVVVPTRTEHLLNSRCTTL